jgi:threonine dehydratase
MPTVEDVQRAQRVIEGRVHRTPLLRSGTLSETLGADARFKAELFQRTGSFKVRGVLNTLSRLDDEAKGRGVISISAGNHAQAVAWGSREEGIDALIVMWQDASPLKIEATRGYGASVDDSPADPTAAFAHLDVLQAETGRTLIHPFNDPAVIAGQGTVGLEILEDAPEVDVVLVPCGGGGLVTGIAVAVKALRPQARVIAVEPDLSPALHEGLKAGKSVPVTPRSAADALSAPFAGERCIELCRELGVESVLVAEDELVHAFRWLYTRTKLACELGAAASAAALLSGKVAVERGQTVVAVVSGGNVGPRQAAAILGS